VSTDGNRIEIFHLDSFFFQRNPKHLDGDHSISFLCLNAENREETFSSTSKYIFVAGNMWLIRMVQEVISTGLLYRVGQ
jgi:hypothetical protein